MSSAKILGLTFAFACAAAAQTKPATPAKPAPKTTSRSAAPAAAGPAQPVITIQNLCVERKPTSECKTVVTRADFERLLAAVRPNLPPAARVQLAQKYVELLTFSDKAIQAGLDKSPEFQEQLRLMRMQALASAYSRYLQEKFSKASDAEVEKYYQENRPAYEEVTLRRIYIPKPAAPAADKKPALDADATKALAEKIQTRAAAGEDFDKLQEEAFVAANPEAPKNGASPTTLGPRRRGQLPASQEKAVFELEPGKVSQLLDEPAGYFIYKVEKKEVLPLSQVKAQIARQLEEQKMRDAIQRTIDSVKATYNDDYFKVPEAEPKSPAPKPNGEKKPADGESKPTPPPGDSR